MIQINNNKSNKETKMNNRFGSNKLVRHNTKNIAKMLKNIPKKWQTRQQINNEMIKQSNNK